MEVFRAVSDFTAPNADSNILSFSKGDTFEVFDSRQKVDWWGARRLNDNTIGYVPSKYLQYEERRIGKLLPENYHEHREKHLKRFAAMQNSDQHKHPVRQRVGERRPVCGHVSSRDYCNQSSVADYWQHLGVLRTRSHVPEGLLFHRVFVNVSRGYEDFDPEIDYLPPPAAETLPDIPTPDYDPDTPVAERNSFVFIEKFKDVITHINTIEELYSEIPEPDPDYLNDEDSTDFPPPPPPISGDESSQAASKDVPASPTSSAKPTVIGVRNGGVSSPEEEGQLIQPRKLSNPCMESRERQALHKELLMNYKLGKDVLKKPELDKALQKRKEAQKRKEWEEMHANKRTSLELKLEERANRLKEDDEKMKPITEGKEEQQPELLRMHRRITTKTQPPPT
ncbi:hypothetical protein BaRGS_00025936 [Batillaria attramentaria]|uniref:SH3 domain-containing protein n=1 Tax=Batillaria attramentaria TaxID=370345 RepID=A0ABD0K739_9CAEN